MSCFDTGRVVTSPTLRELEKRFVFILMTMYVG